MLWVPSTRLKTMRKLKFYGVEAAGEGLETGKHAASLGAGAEGVFHGMLTYVLQDSNGQIQNTSSISAGLDYPGVGPEHSFLKTLKRAQYVSATDKEAVDAFLTLSREEGILPALESSHAVAYAMKTSSKNEEDPVNRRDACRDEETKTWKP